MLDLEHFPSGVQYHHNRGYLNQILKKSIVPYVFHMCWTSNRVDKVRYFKIMNMWYLPEEKQCTESTLMLKAVTGSGQFFRKPSTTASITSSCCIPTRWHLPNITAYTPKPMYTLRHMFHKLKTEEMTPFELCHTATYSSTEWLKNCDSFFINRKGGEGSTGLRVEDLRFRASYP